MRANVLIVEDEAVTAHFISSVVENINHNIVALESNPDKVMQLIKLNEIDIVFMDINLNCEIDGVELAKDINRHISAYFIFITANSDTNTLQRISKLPNVTFLTKPFNKKQLMATLALVSSSLESKQVNKLPNGYIYNQSDKVLFKDDICICLAKKEALFLNLLTNSNNHSVSFIELEHTLWNKQSVSDSTRRNFISRFNKKFEQPIIETLRGVGYRLY